jgi:hypothetical protein
VPQDFWVIANQRFAELEHELNLNNFAFIVYGFVLIEALDSQAFLKCTTRSLLLN